MIADVLILAFLNIIFLQQLFNGRYENCNLLFLLRAAENFKALVYEVVARYLAGDEAGDVQLAVVQEGYDVLEVLRGVAQAADDFALVHDQRHRVNGERLGAQADYHDVSLGADAVVLLASSLYMVPIVPSLVRRLSIGWQRVNNSIL